MFILLYLSNFMHISNLHLYICVLTNRNSKKHTLCIVIELIELLYILFESNFVRGNIKFFFFFSAIIRLHQIEEILASNHKNLLAFI